MVTDTTNAVIGDKIGCPVMCYIRPGAAGACDRYANHDGQLVRVDPHIVLERTVSHGFISTQSISGRHPIAEKLRGRQPTRERAAHLEGWA